MADTERMAASKRLLRGEFKGVTLWHSETGVLTLDVSALGDVDVTVITKDDGRVMKRTPTGEQTTAQENNEDVTQSSPTEAAFDPANAVVKAGQVQLNKLSKYLLHLPDTAIAELLVSKDTAKIFDRDIGTFNEDIASIRTIDESHGIHHEGQLLTGMPIFDRPDTAKDLTYEQAWAKEIIKAWEHANESGAAVTTGLAIGTTQIVDGTRSFSDEPGMSSTVKTVDNNLYSNVENINAVLYVQGGQKILTSDGYDDPDDAHLQWTATQSQSLHPMFRNHVYKVDFAKGRQYYCPMDDDGYRASSRPVALQILPAP